MNNKQNHESDKIEKYFESIVSFCQLNYPRIAYSLRPPASDAEIDDLELLVGTSLPEQFRQLYKLANGQVEDCALFPDGYELMPLDMIQSTWKMLKNMYDSQYQMRIEREEDGPVRNTWWHPLWIPFAFQVSGDHYCIDMNPSREGTQGQVIEFIHDDEPRPLLGASLAEFLKHFDYGIHSGKYLMHPEWGTFVANM